MDIHITSTKIDQQTLQALCDNWFGKMVKIVVDVEKKVVAVGGQLHADAEVLLVEQGAAQINLWGANFYPFNQPDKRIEYTALINIRPHQGNPSMEIRDEAIKRKIKIIVEEYLLGPHESLVL